MFSPYWLYSSRLRLYMKKFPLARHPAFPLGNKETQTMSEIHTPQGAFLRSNTYLLRDHVPWYVAFLISGDLQGRDSLHFDSSLNASPDLLEEWYNFHSRRCLHPPVVAFHFPLEGEDLLNAMARLGLGSHTLALGTALYLKALSRLRPFAECYIPITFLQSIAAETRAVESVPRETLNRVANGAWLSKKPQSPWSRWHKAVDGQEGYLWYASVYAHEKEDWDKKVNVVGYQPSDNLRRRHFDSLEEWLNYIRSNGIRLVPVVAATQGSPEILALAMKVQEKDEPRGLIYQNNPPEGKMARVPDKWWDLSTGFTSNLRLETL